MISDFEEQLDEFIEHWHPQESGRQLQIRKDSVTSEEYRQLISDIFNIREYIQGRNLIADIVYQSGAFEYTLVWENDGNVVVRRENDSNISPDRLFSDEEAQSAIEPIRENHISSVENLRSVVTELLDTAEVEGSVRYDIPGEQIDEYLQEEVNSDLDLTYYFTVQGAESALTEQNFEDLKDYFYTDTGKRILIVRGISDAIFGSDVGIFPPSQLDTQTFEVFLNRQSFSNDQLTSVRRECAIDYYDELYLPPDYLTFDNPEETEFGHNVQKALKPYQLMFCIIGISNIARQIDDGWDIRINGRRVIESTVSLNIEGENMILHEPSSEKGQLELQLDQVNEFIDIFNWIYTSRTLDRIIVFRNIVTLYSTTIIGAVKEIGDIAESVKSNFRFYIEDSIEEFVSVQQDVSSYVFETHRELSDIRRGLANNLSRDLFRVFAFTAITWAGIISQLNKIAQIRLALAISIIPFCIYLGLGLRSSYSLSQQFKSIENGRDQYYSMYENRIDENILRKIKDTDGSDTMKRQFTFDRWLYYIVFGGLLIFGIYVIIDLVFLEFFITDIVKRLSGR